MYVGSVIEVIVILQSLQNFILVVIGVDEITDKELFQELLLRLDHFPLVRHGTLGSESGQAGHAALDEGQRVFLLLCQDVHSIHNFIHSGFISILKYVWYRWVHMVFHLYY